MKFIVIYSKTTWRVLSSSKGRPYLLCATLNFKRIFSTSLNSTLENENSFIFTSYTHIQPEVWLPSRPSSRNFVCFSGRVCGTGGGEADQVSKRLTRNNSKEISYLSVSVRTCQSAKNGISAFLRHKKGWLFAALLHLKNWYQRKFSGRLKKFLMASDLLW